MRLESVSRYALWVLIPLFTACSEGDRHGDDGGTSPVTPPAWVDTSTGGGGTGTGGGTPPPAPAPAPTPGGTSYVEVNGTVSMESEGFTTNDGFNPVLDTGASGGKAMQVRADYSNGSGSLAFQVTLLQGGRWYVWIRTRAPDSESNGLYLKLDGSYVEAPAGHPHAGKRDIYLIKGPWSWKPEWQGDGAGNHRGPITIDTTAGPHVLAIVKRKSEEPLIDKIVLTKSSQAPAGMGPPPTLP